MIFLILRLCVESVICSKEILNYFLFLFVVIISVILSVII